MIGSIKHLNIEVTKLCNQKCVYCFNDSGYHAKGETLALKTWIEVLSALKGRGLESILITGGEPFIWPKTIDLFRAAQEMELETSVLSNGLNVPKLVQSHADVLRKLQVAQISLDAMDPELHDARRGLKGAWRQATDAIGAFQSLQVPVEVSCTVSDENLDELEGLGEFCRSIGAALLIRPMAIMGRASNARISVVNQERLRSVLGRMNENGVSLVRDRFVYAPDMKGLSEDGRKLDNVTVEADGKFRSGSLQSCGESPVMFVTDLIKVA
jgi:MoaA/NifB/PqqE/SkfB family radical SAM enzyme